MGRQQVDARAGDSGSCGEPVQRHLTVGCHHFWMRDRYKPVAHCRRRMAAVPFQVRMYSERYISVFC